MTARGRHPRIHSGAEADARAPKPAPYSAPKIDGDLTDAFAERAAQQYADVRLLDSMADVPVAVADVLRGRNMAAEIHVAPDSALSLAFSSQCRNQSAPPGQNDAALTAAPFAIAATGTLAYPSGKGRPASWHFRPVLEITVLRAADIAGELEDVLAKIGPLPSTLNLVTGPSRTGDIEQTMELGAHGPQALAILIVKD